MGGWVIPTNKRNCNNQSFWSVILILTFWWSVILIFWQWLAYLDYHFVIHFMVIFWHKMELCFVWKKRITKPPLSQTQADLWDVLKALAPPECPSMHADVKVFYKKFRYNRYLKLKMYSKKINDWYTKSFVFHHNQKRSQSPIANLLWKTKNRCQSFKFIFSGACFEMLYLLALKWPQSKNSRMQRSAFTFRFAKRIIWRANERCNWKNSDLENQFHDFQQNHGDLQKELLFTRRKTNSLQKHFPESVLP